MFGTTRSYVMILVSACVAGTSAFAQNANAAGASAIDSASVPLRIASALVAGPRLEATATAMRPLTQATGALASQRKQPMNMGQPVALMIVGGAAIVLGAFIGDDPGTLFMIGGAGSVLVGLYQYIK
jgi:hypothetical protein